MADLSENIGRRVRLRCSHRGSLQQPDQLDYTVQEAQPGELGTITSNYCIRMDSGVEIYCMGSDFQDPDEQFAELFELLEE